MNEQDSIDRAMAYEAAEREKFEAWAKAKTQLRLDRDMASYLSGTTQFAWMAWTERALQADAKPAARARPMTDDEWMAAHGSPPRKFLRWGDCRCVLTQYCDGCCNPIYEDAKP